MKISAFTIGSENVASSRLRSFYPFYHASKYGIEVFRDQGVRKILESDCLHIQKIFNLKLFLLAVLFRLLGRKVIFDFDDQQYGMRNFIYMILHIWIATYVTTDTEPRKIYWEKFCFIRKRIVVIPDAIDKPLMHIYQPIKCEANDLNRNIIWIGSESTFGSILPLVKFLKDCRKYKLTVITGGANIENLSKIYPWIKFLKWKMDILFDEEYEGSFMVLNHDVDENTARLKSDNKMVLAIAAGLIPVVSRTFSYERLASRLSAINLVYDDILDSIPIIESININWASSFLKEARDYIDEIYSSEVVFRKLLKTIMC